MNILYIGDVMGPMGMSVVREVLPDLREEKQVDFVVAQSENVTDGKGMDLDDYHTLRELGIDAFTGGNHSLAQPSIESLLVDDTAPVTGPKNMQGFPGPGYKIIETNGKRVLIVSILGSIVGRQAQIGIDNPLSTIDALLATIPRDSYDVSIVNYHGDFSSEKVVFGHYVDGRVSVVVGDHWHVPTADAMILPRKTAYITDVGMCGSLDSSLGITYESIIPRWRDGMHTKNILETQGAQQFNCLFVAFDTYKNMPMHIQHIRKIIA